MTHCKIKENVFLWKINLGLGFKMITLKKILNLIKEYIKGKIFRYSLIENIYNGEIVIKKWDFEEQFQCLKNKAIVRVYLGITHGIEMSVTLRDRQRVLTCSLCIGSWARVGPLQTLKSGLVALQGSWW